MNLSTGELKFLSAAMALHIAGDGAVVRVELLRGIFRRPAEFNSVRDQLIIGAFITHDPHRGELRVLPDRVWQALNQYGITPELFPKDEFGAAMAGVSASNLTNLCQLSRAAEERVENNFAPVPPKPKPPDPPPPTEKSSRSHAFMPMPPVGKNHALAAENRFSHDAAPPSSHVSCNSFGIKKIHEHEVGELAKRTTEQILADIKKLQPNITPENIENWRSRIEREDAELVNGVVRQAYLQRQQIRNLGGWMNTCYMRGIQNRSEAPKKFKGMKEAAK